MDTRKQQNSFSTKNARQPLFCDASQFLIMVWFLSCAFVLFSIDMESDGFASSQVRWWFPDLLGKYGLPNGTSIALFINNTSPTLLKLPGSKALDCQSDGDMPATYPTVALPGSMAVGSPAQAVPTPSKLPDSMLSEPSSSDTGERIQPPVVYQPQKATDGLPEPLIRLQLNDLRHEATKAFLDQFEPTKDMADLIRIVLRLLYVPEGNKKSRAPPPSFTPHIPGTRSITLVIRDMGGVAYTTGLEIDNDHKETHFSLSYIQHVSKSASSPAAVRKELLGVVCHELVHSWQYDALGTAPSGLIEGIADWVRLNAGFVPPHWKRDCNGNWDRGYQNTGYFLDWIERQKGNGSVRRLNEALRRTKYDENKLWKGLFGRNVTELYSGYCKSIK